MARTSSRGLCVAWAVLARDRDAEPFWRGQGEGSVELFAKGFADEGRVRAQGVRATRVWAVPGRTQAGPGLGASPTLRASRRRLGRCRIGEERC